MNSKTSSAWISQAECARRLKVSAPMVTKYLRRGMPFSANKGIPWIRAKKWVKDHVNSSRSGSWGARQRRAKKTGSSSAPGSSERRSYAEAQRNREWLRVEKEQLELDARKGKLLDRDKVKEEWSGLINAARNGLLLVSSRAGPLVAALSDPRECQAVIEREIREALTALSTGDDQRL